LRGDRHPIASSDAGQARRGAAGAIRARLPELAEARPGAARAPPPRKMVRAIATAKRL
jgi:hypothetical protein